jgi:hypothetical protein
MADRKAKPAQPIKAAYPVPESEGDKAERRGAEDYKRAGNTSVSTKTTRDEQPESIGEKIRLALEGTRTQPWRSSRTHKRTWLGQP